MALLNQQELIELAQKARLLFEDGQVVCLNDAATPEHVLRFAHLVEEAVLKKALPSRRRRPTGDPGDGSRED